MRALEAACLAVLVLAACDKRKEPEALRPTALDDRRAEPPADYSGSYGSNWGPVECTQTGDKVKFVYTASGARMDCEASGSKLTCRWLERTARGHGKFKRLPNGNLVGTWGYSQSDENRGAWMLTKK
jgi:hypothetical protein